MKMHQIIILILLLGIIIGILLLVGGQNKTENNISNNIEEKKLFTSSNLGYTVMIPNNWISSSFSSMYGELDENGNDYDYFRNELVDTPLEMSLNGVWITISKYLPQSNFENFIIKQSEEKTILDRNDIIINGMSAVMQHEIPNFSDDAGYSNTVYIDAGKNYYEVLILTPSEETFNINKEIINDIISSFKKNKQE